MSWASRAACRHLPPRDVDRMFFGKGHKQQTAARIVCLGCPVIAECLADALDNRTEFGVWGGMTERERRAMLKRHPDIRSWRTLFESARNRGERSAS